MRFLTYFFLFITVISFAQEDEIIQSIYFDFDKYDIRKDQQKELKNFIIESDIQLDYFEEVVKHIERKR